jgi:hypothetical protein
MICLSLKRRHNHDHVINQINWMKFDFIEELGQLMKLINRYISHYWPYEWKKLISLVGEPVILTVVASGHKISLIMVTMILWQDDNT